MHTGNAQPTNVTRDINKQKKTGQGHRRVHGDPHPPTPHEKVTKAEKSKHHQTKATDAKGNDRRGMHPASPESDATKKPYPPELASAASTKDQHEQHG